MNYAHLKPSSSVRVTDPDLVPTPTPRARSRAWVIALVAIALILLAVACGVPIAVRRARGGSGRPVRGPTAAVRKACGVTRYPELCLETLGSAPGSDPRTLVHVSVNATMVRFKRAVSSSSEILNWEMDTLSKSAYDDCMELLEESVELLANALTVVSPMSVDNTVNQGGSKQDVMTWLSGAMTNQDTCTDGLNEAGGTIKNQMAQNLVDLSELVSNCLAIYSATNGIDDDFAGAPIQNRRLLGFEPEIVDKSGFPKWMSRSERVLLDTPTPGVQADIVVAQDGSGTVTTITEAIKKAPEYSNRHIIILVKAGTYRENNLKVGRKKTNLWFLGEGKGRTVITGKLSVGHDQITTFHTASFAATGSGFVARGISFVNEAGPGNHQAVALRVGADHAVVYQCEVRGYQDTLYVHSQRQFFRECDIYGTVDFIFGNAAVVFQHCAMWARKPMDLQKNTITAQNRKDPNQNTGISIHSCEVKPTSDLEPVKSTFPTYLGRPWKIYSRVVYMESFLGDHIDPRGWLEWNATSPLNLLYYGEYGNTGPRADVSMRAKWPGLHVSMSRIDALKFTVTQFIFGDSWITPTGVAYDSGLSS
ncbi:putative pectinesterase/pectinesterase inhibitor 61 [Silene latifolia]|uniref:putative pectinesterase/pectinesterase inhibitor 61 n=1 Tax=Silene latifolia TaxID=37657 RepID=UPI003D77BAEF